MQDTKTLRNSALFPQTTHQDDPDAYKNSCSLASGRQPGPQREAVAPVTSRTPPPGHTLNLGLEHACGYGVFPSLGWGPGLPLSGGGWDGVSLRILSM